MSSKEFFSRRKRKIIENVLVNCCGNTRKQARNATKSGGIVMTPGNMPLASLTFMHATSFALWLKAVGIGNKPQPLLLYDEDEKTNTEDPERHFPGMMTFRGVSTEFLESIGLVKSPMTAMLRTPEDLTVQPMIKSPTQLPIYLRFNKPDI